MAIALAVGLAVALYIRRKRISVHLVGRAITSCFRSSGKRSTHGSGGRTSAKPVSNRVTSSRAVISKKGEDHIEMKRYDSCRSANLYEPFTNHGLDMLIYMSLVSLIKKPAVSNSPNDSGKPAPAPRSK